MSTKLNRQERSDLTAFAVIIAALLLLVGSWFLTPPAVAAQEQVATVVTLPSEEVATDLESEPSGVRGLTMGELLHDAWKAHSTLPAPDMPAPLTVVPEYVETYDGAVPEFPGDFYKVPSAEFPGLTHVFQSTAAFKA
ncbi:hypothetical protein [Arthrobacter sp. ISL-95]|uniref:hypothetical protein n=1 Tax=Arthrobacter sp. ISL-95 TaxID=2819116 RepID=UPI001BE93CD7|nr:hypothetical protein [Arthrobacter sp. ISL-95]MBT2587928.1 hypothetical protein [Arthrobacter sp. ISL-95]